MRAAILRASIVREKGEICLLLPVRRGIVKWSMSGSFNEHALHPNIARESNQSVSFPTVIKHNVSHPS